MCSNLFCISNKIPPPPAPRKHPHILFTYSSQCSYVKRCYIIPRYTVHVTLNCMNFFVIYIKIVGATYSFSVSGHQWQRHYPLFQKFMAALPWHTSTCDWSKIDQVHSTYKVYKRFLQTIEIFKRGILCILFDLGKKKE